MGEIGTGSDLTLAGIEASHDLQHESSSWGAFLQVSPFEALQQSLRGANPETRRCLSRVGDALREDNLTAALRELDQGWRRLPKETDRLAPIYGRLLSLEGRDHYAALRLLQRAAGFSPDPDVAALIALTLLRLDRTREACQQLEQALANYCVFADGLLARVATEVAQHPSVAAPGWIGRGSSLQVIGELAQREPASALTVKVGTQAEFSQMLRIQQHEGHRCFGFQAPSLGPNDELDVSSHGIALLGSGARLPPNLALDGRVRSKGRRLFGWARIGWAPIEPVQLRFEDEYRNTWEDSTRRMASTGWRWAFDLDLRATPLKGERIRISARLPDARWQPLPDSPLLLERAVRAAGRASPRLLLWRETAAHPKGNRGIRRARFTDVIIPVYGNREESLACLEAVLATADESTRVVVVDDASEDAALAAALDKYHQNGQVKLLRNRRNLGFVASVNRALALHPTHDAVLLNSDTLVFAEWLPRLRDAAYSDPDIGTVTPLSNSGSIASYPRPEGTAVDPAAAAMMHALAATTHSGHSVDIPVGIGFCLYMRRDCLREVGRLDETVFGQGYGEETDFCLRARRRGWSHRLAADVFVYHAGGLSFGGRRAALLDRSARLINLRHPGYDRFIASFLAQDPLRMVRRRLDERRLGAFQGRFVLIVTLGLAGGVDRFVAERLVGLRAQGLYGLVLRPARAGDRRHCELWTDAIELPNLRYDVPGDLSGLMALLGGLRLEGIEIQHFLHLDARLIDAVRALPLPYDVFVHDYSWICPRVTLIDGSGRYCGEPAVAVCQSCVRRNGSNLGESISVPALRERSARWLGGARRVLAPSLDTASRMQRHFEGLQVGVQPHTTPEAAPLESRKLARNSIRVALIGAIGRHKGYGVLLQCARDARTRRLPLEFVVIGYTENDAPLLATGKVFITGSYTEGEAAALLRREQPDIAWLPSVWPETWCYTLDYALGSALPVVAFDLGAIAERLRAAGTGELLSLQLGPKQINDRLLQIAAAAMSTTVQSLLKRSQGDANMLGTQSGENAMNKTSNGSPAQAVQKQEEGLAASVQVLPLPAGLYLFSVKAAGPSVVREAGNLSLPAVHVGLGPGVRSDQVEFVAGPSTEGAWLFAPGDLLVTKINGSGATLIMTSVRAPGGQVLSIKVERLENRVNEPSEPVQGIAAAPALKSKVLAGLKGAGKAPTNGASKAAPVVPTSSAPLPMHIAAHIRTRGDMNFANVPWAGRVAPGLWIESFSLRPLEGFSAQDIEYKGLTGTGFETPWLSDEKMCGTKGMSVPLVGFAVRLKPSPTAATYDCEYSGYFQSGQVTGPLRNGAPCKSTVANDPLEGIQIRLVKRAGFVLPAAPRAAGTANAVPKAKRRKAKITKVHARTAAKRAAAARLSGRSSRATRRSPTRRP